MNKTLEGFKGEVAKFFEIFDLIGLKQNDPDQTNGLRGILFGFIKFMMNCSHNVDSSVLSQLKEFCNKNEKILGKLAKHGSDWCQSIEK